MNMIATLVPTVRLDCDATTGMQKQDEFTMTTRVEPGVLEVAGLDTLSFRSRSA